MKTSSWSLLAVLLSITMLCLAGCGDEPKPASMAEGVELSEIEAYEQAVQAMESEDADSMEINEGDAEPPAEPPAE